MTLVLAHANVIVQNRPLVEHFTCSSVIGNLHSPGRGVRGKNGTAEGTGDAGNSSSASTAFRQHILATRHTMCSSTDRNAADLLRCISPNHGQHGWESDGSHWRGRAWARHQGYESGNQLFARGDHQPFRRICDFPAAGGP